MKLEMRRSNEPATRDTIARLQEELDVVLPADYVEFLLDQNGGLPQTNSFSLGDDGRDTVAFFGAYTGHDYDDLATAALDYEGRLPPECLPIGDDPGGNLILLAVAGPETGSVWFWDHEMEGDEDEEPGRDNMTKLAPTFSDFIASLTSS